MTLLPIREEAQPRHGAVANMVDNDQIGAMFA